MPSAISMLNLTGDNPSVEEVLSNLQVPNIDESERMHLEVYKSLLCSIEPIERLMYDAQQQVDSIFQSLKAMSIELDNVKESVEPVLTELSLIKSRRTELEDKIKAHEKDQWDSRLCEDERQVLCESEITTPPFMKALTRLIGLQGEHANVKLTTHDEEIARKLEERLFPWVMSLVDELGMENAELPESLEPIFLFLKDSPKFPELTGRLITIRADAVIKYFLLAITQGRRGSAANPIEIHSHNPVRYVGDMLAWIHQAIATEKDLIASMVVDPAQATMVLANVFEKVVLPLRMRIEETLRSNLSEAVVFKLIYLLRFYQTVLIREVKGSKITRTITELINAAEKLFMELADESASALLEHAAHSTPRNAIPDSELARRIQLIAEIISIREAAVKDEPEAGEEVSLFHKTLDVLMIPIHQAIVLSSGNLDRITSAVFIINALDFVAAALKECRQSTNQHRLLNEQVEAQLKLLVEDELKSFLLGSGLIDAYRAISTDEGIDSPLFTLPSTVQNLLDRFYGSLSTHTSAYFATRSQIIGSLAHRHEIQQRAGEYFLRFYNRLVKVIETAPIAKDISGLRSASELAVIMGLDRTNEQELE